MNSIIEPHPPSRLFRELIAGKDAVGMPWALLKATRPRARSAASYSPVIVMPGLSANDASTLPLRYFLNRNGFPAEGWGQGINLGGRGLIKDLSELSDRWDVDRSRTHKDEGEVPALVDKLIDHVRRRSARLGRPVHLIGWSLGGYVAREVARDLPDQVRSVVTLAAPVIGGPKYTSLAWIYRNRGTDLDWIEAEIEKRNAVPIKQPITAIYGLKDGIINPAAMIDRHSPNVRHVELNVSHMGIGLNAQVWDIVKEALINAENN